MTQPPPVEIVFTTKGLDEVQRALKNIQDLVTRVERSSKSTAKARSSKEDVKAMQDVVSSVKGYVAAEKMATAASRAGVSARARDYKREADLKKKFAQLGYKAEVEAAKESGRERARVARETARAEEKAAKEAAKEKAKAAKATAKEADDRARMLFGNPEHTRTGAVGRGLKSGGRIVAGLGRGAMDALGGFSVSDAIQQEAALQGRAASIAASSPGDISGSEIRDRAQKVAVAQGVDASQVLDMYDNIKKLTGNINFAMDAAPSIAKIATATGADMGDVGSLAGNILAANPKIDKEAMNAQLRMFAQQGMVGGVELSDFAKYGGRITAGATLFGGKAEENQAVLGGFAQIARQYGGAASAAEATLGAQRFATDVAKKSDHLKGMGIEVSDKHGKLRSAQDIALDMLDKTGGDVTKLSELKLGERGNRVMTGLSEIYRQGGGGESGKKAVIAEIEKYAKANLSAEEVELRNKKRLAAADVQLNRAMIQLKQEVGSQLVPVMGRFVDEVLIPNIPQVKRLMEAFGVFADFMFNHPWSGLGVIMGAALTKEIVVAFATSAFEKRLAEASGAAGGVAKAFGIAAAAVIAYQVGKEAIDADIKGANSKDDKRRALVNEVTNFTRAGKLNSDNPEDRSRAEALAQQVTAAQKQLNEDAANPSMLKQGFSKLTGLVDPGAAAEMTKNDKANVDAQNKALTDALNQLTRVMEAQGPKGPADPNHPSRGNSGSIGAHTRGRPQ